MGIFFFFFLPAWLATTIFSKTVTTKWYLFHLKLKKSLSSYSLIKAFFLVYSNVRLADNNRAIRGKFEFRIEFSKRYRQKMRFSQQVFAEIIASFNE